VHLLLYDSLLAYLLTGSMINVVFSITVVMDFVGNRDAVVMYLYLPGVLMDVMCMLMTLRLLRLLKAYVPPPTSPLASHHMPPQCAALTLGGRSFPAAGVSTTRH
jgi:hypothetical protein